MMINGFEMCWCDEHVNRVDRSSNVYEYCALHEHIYQLNSVRIPIEMVGEFFQYIGQTTMARQPTVDYIIIVLIAFLSRSLSIDY